MTPQVLDRPRPIGTHEAAFLRELLEGLPAKRAKRHLFTADRANSPEVDQALDDLRQALSRAARAASKPHLLEAIPFDALTQRIALERLRERRPKEADPQLVAQKKLEIYRRVPADGFSDEEMDAIAREELMAEGKLRKIPPPEPLPAPHWNVANARTALELLQPLVSTAPVPTQLIDLWFKGGTLKSLRAAGVATVGDLTELILRRGHRWNRAVPRLGLKRAMRIAAWLRAEQTAWSRAPVLGLAALTSPEQLSRGEVAVARAAAGAIVPFEQLVLPPALDGHAGTNREGLRPCAIETDNDHGAIERWLAAACPNRHTRRAYAREAERLLLWCVAEKNLPMSSLTVDGCIEYREFLHALGDEKAPWPWRRPRAHWLAPRASLPRTSPLWKPFAPQPMNPGSIQRALIILRALFDWLVARHYLLGNPWAAVNLKGAAQRRRGDMARREVQRRSLGDAERGYVLAALEEIEGEERRLRARVVVQFAMYTGLRVDELARSRVGDLEPFVLKDGTERHLLHVVGKGGKPRTVTVPLLADQVLQSYLARRGAADWSREHAQGQPLVAAIGAFEGGASKTSAPLTPGRLHEIAKWVFDRAAGLAEAEADEEAAGRLRKASMHWLRHTFGTELGRGRVDVRTIMVEMGHSDVSTTLLYISPDHQARFEQVDGAFNQQAQRLV
jgi:site-specific recombinase XerD